MDSKEELAQPVGNAKIRSEFDTDAATVVGPNTNDAVLFPRSRSDQDGNMTGLSLTGTVLAKRYKILEMIDGDSFKAHDLALDQTVTVRQATPTSPRDVDAWRQKVQRLVFVRNPNFLNVLDVVFDKSSGFVITEHARGRSIGELLRERSRFDPEDALALMTPLAGALDLAASFACGPNLVSARWLFAEKRHSFAADAEQPRLSEWASSFVKMDVWEFVRPRKGIKWPLPTSKAQSGDSRKLAVEQAALLTYELLGGQKENRKRKLKPINGLGDAGNAVLYRGLEGSPVFESSGDFFHKFESAIQSVSLESSALPGAALPTRENSVSLPGTSAVIRGFNRDTRCLATGVLGVMVFAASLLAVLVPEHHPSAVDPTAAVQPPGNLLLNANNSTLFKEVGVRGKSSAGETAVGQEKSVDQAFSEVSQKENRTTQVEADASTPTPVLASTPEISHLNAQVAANLRSPAHWKDHAQSIGLKITRARSSGPIRPKFIDVKMRLIALWHQSLAQSEKSRNWTAFSNSNKGARKKVACTAETRH
jgi:hypothetical protein